MNLLHWLARPQPYDNEVGRGYDAELLDYAMSEPDEFLHICRNCGEWIGACMGECGDK